MSTIIRSVSGWIPIERTLWNSIWDRYLVLFEIVTITNIWLVYGRNWLRIVQFFPRSLGSICCGWSDPLFACFKFIFRAATREQNNLFLKCNPIDLFWLLFYVSIVGSHCWLTPSTIATSSLRLCSRNVFCRCEYIRWFVSHIEGRVCLIW